MVNLHNIFKENNNDNLNIISIVNLYKKNIFTLDFLSDILICPNFLVSIKLLFS